MLGIEDYIARRKKEDKLNEFDLNSRTQNMKVCVDYVFEYFNNYLNITQTEEKTVLHNEKLEKYRKQLGNMSLRLGAGLLAYIMSMGSRYISTLETF